MWQTNTIWFEISIVTIFILIGNIYFGHFEERSPRWRALLKYLVTLTIVILISIYVGRVYALGLLALGLIPVAYVHAVLLPRKGINGLTGEPKKKYYEFRGWSTDIFSEKPQAKP
jgi:hypothetical protein